MKVGYIPCIFVAIAAAQEAPSKGNRLLDGLTVTSRGSCQPDELEKLLLSVDREAGAIEIEQAVAECLHYTQIKSEEGVLRIVPPRSPQKPRSVASSTSETASADKLVIEDDYEFSIAEDTLIETLQIADLEDGEFLTLDDFNLSGEGMEKESPEVPVIDHPIFRQSAKPLSKAPPQIYHTNDIGDVVIKTVLKPPREASDDEQATEIGITEVAYSAPVLASTLIDAETASDTAEEKYDYDRAAISLRGFDPIEVELESVSPVIETPASQVNLPKALDYYHLSSLLHAGNPIYHHPVVLGTTHPGTREMLITKWSGFPRGPLSGLPLTPIAKPPKLDLSRLAKLSISAPIVRAPSKR